MALVRVITSSSVKPRSDDRIVRVHIAQRTPTPPVMYAAEPAPPKPKPRIMSSADLVVTKEQAQTIAEAAKRNGIPVPKYRIEG